MEGTSMDKPKFDPTINWGHVLQVVVIVVGGVMAVYALSGRVSGMELAINGLKDDVKSLTSLVATSARMEERINYMERRINTLEVRQQIDTQPAAAPSSGRR